jgi:predicted nicotinamide N-methyase
MDRAARRRWIAEHLRAQPAPLCPELTLHLADDLIGVWHAAETAEGVAQLATPFWAFCWPGGAAVARVILDAPERVRDRRVLDFASGCGVASLACVRAGAREIEASEIDPWASAATELHAGVRVRVREEDLVGRDEGWSVILAGDVCYRQEPSARIERWLRSLAARGATVLLGDPGRNFTPRVGLRELARFEVATSPDVEGASARTPIVWQLEP